MTKDPTNETAREKLHRLIPGGAHTYSRGDDQFPSIAPGILDRGVGAYVWDTNGRRFLDYGMGLRSVTLGYAQPEVIAAAVSELQKGNTLPRASVTELRAAELMTSLAGTEMVKFAKNGSTVTTAAVKLARAYTNRSFVAVCEDHPFFSFDDWFISSTVMSKGTERASQATLKFAYNDISSLERLFESHDGQVAAVILEPTTGVSPCQKACDHQSQDDCIRCSQAHNNFLKQVQQTCKRHGAVFILDEMITGFRFDLRGAWRLFDLEPDLLTFGKGMANGFSVAALTGKAEIMSLGGINKEGMERVFLASTTHGAEMAGLGAFLKTAEIYERDDVVQHLWSYGRQLQMGLNSIAKEFGVAHSFSVGGYPCSPLLSTKNRDGVNSPILRTLFLQEMVKRGVLMSWIAISHSHGTSELDQTLSAAREAMEVYREGLTTNASQLLIGQPVKPVFRQFN